MIICIDNVVFVQFEEEDLEEGEEEEDVRKLTIYF